MRRMFFEIVSPRGELYMAAHALDAQRYTGVRRADQGFIRWVRLLALVLGALEDLNAACIVCQYPLSASSKQLSTYAGQC